MNICLTCTAVCDIHTHSAHTQEAHRGNQPIKVYTKKPNDYEYFFFLITFCFSPPRRWAGEARVRQFFLLYFSFCIHFGRVFINSGTRAFADNLRSADCESESDRKCLHATPSGTTGSALLSLLSAALYFRRVSCYITLSHFFFLLLFLRLRYIFASLRTFRSNRSLTFPTDTVVNTAV